MTKYNEVQKTFTAYRQAQREYWNDLQDKVAAVASGFSQFLGVDLAPSGDGKYVEFGRKSGNQFERCHARELETWRLELEFALQILVEENEQKHPKERLIVSMSVERREGEYQFKIEHSDGKWYVQVPRSFEPSDQEELYQALLELTLQHYDPNIFG